MLAVRQPRLRGADTGASKARHGNKWCMGGRMCEEWRSHGSVRPDGWWCVRCCETVYGADGEVGKSACGPGQAEIVGWAHTSVTSLLFVIWIKSSQNRLPSVQKRI